MTEKLPFSMVLCRRPVSANNNSKHYQQAVETAAMQAFKGQAPFSTNVYARIIWFHRSKSEQDVDNIPKRLLDALKGVVYEDDQVIRQCLAVGIDIGQGDYEIDGSSVSDELYQDLLVLLGDDTQEHILYIEIGQLTKQRVVFGPIDRGQP